MVTLTRGGAQRLMTQGNSLTMTSSTTVMMMMMMMMINSQAVGGTNVDTRSQHHAAKVRFQ